MSLWLQLALNEDLIYTEEGAPDQGGALLQASALGHDRRTSGGCRRGNSDACVAFECSLDEVDPELLRTFDRLGIPLAEQKRLSNVAVDAVFDSVSIATTFKKELREHGIIFCSISEAVRDFPELVRKHLGSVVRPCPGCPPLWSCGTCLWPVWFARLALWPWQATPMLACYHNVSVCLLLWQPRLIFQAGTLKSLSATAGMMSTKSRRGSKLQRQQGSTDRALQVPVADNYYAALNSAVFSDGSFVFIPKGVKSPMEISTYFRINASETGQVTVSSLPLSHRAPHGCKFAL